MTNKKVRVATIDKVREIFEACSLVLIKNDKILMQLRDNKKEFFIQDIGVFRVAE